MSDESAAEWSEQVEILYRSQSREIWAMFYAHCHDAELAYDALQEVFSRLQAYTGPTLRDPRAWLLQVGRNWLRDLARHRRIAAHSVDFLDETVGSGHDPVEKATEKESQEQVRNALEQLREEDREILVLKYGLGWNSRRISESLEISTTAVDMRLSRARRRLGKLLEQAGVNHDTSGE